MGAYRGKLIASVLSAAALLAVTAGPTLAAGPPIENLSPAEGAVMVRDAKSGEMSVEYTCPRFENSGGATIDWSMYFVDFATSPEPNADGRLSNTFLIGGAGSRPTNALETTCRAVLPEHVAREPRTIYWQVHRVNCDEPKCREYGPIWSFQIPPPVAPPIGKGPPPRVEYAAVVFCGPGIVQPRPGVCGRRQRAAGRFVATTTTTYRMCVTYPTGRRRCTPPKEAAAGVASTDRIAAGLRGWHKVVWAFEGRRIVRFFWRS